MESWVAVILRALASKLLHPWGLQVNPKGLRILLSLGFRIPEVWDLASHKMVISDPGLSFRM